MEQVWFKSKSIIVWPLREDDLPSNFCVRTQACCSVPLHYGLFSSLEFSVSPIRAFRKCDEWDGMASGHNVDGHGQNAKCVSVDFEILR